MISGGELQASNAQLKSALQAAQSDLEWIISEVKAGKLSPEEAEECMQGISGSAPTVKAATAAVNQARSFLQDESAGLREPGWSPKRNEEVRLMKLGGVPGKVGIAHTAQPPVFCLVAPVLSSVLGRGGKKRRGGVWLQPECRFMLVGPAVDSPDC